MSELPLNINDWNEEQKAEADHDLDECLKAMSAVLMEHIDRLYDDPNKGVFASFILTSRVIAELELKHVTSCPPPLIPQYLMIKQAVAQASLADQKGEHDAP
jgi:hypothetical protein